MDEKQSELEELESMFTSKSVEPILISYPVIKFITKNFCQEIARGGFGTVYLGALRNDVMVAVKQLHHSKDLFDEQFKAEVQCLTIANHENIVKFLGYCAITHEVVMNMKGKNEMVQNERKRFLCFEYAPNGSLHDYLTEKTHVYEWSICYKIIRGICHGLQSLHEKRIYHLDLKPQNVLLGAQMEPKIADFGLSRCNDGTKSIIVTRNLNGTLGYMAPEFIKKGIISSKSDIFSLGIIMKRLLTRSTEDITDNWHESLTVHCRQMKQCIEVARICIEEDPDKRPTISDIIFMLVGTETMMENVPPVIITEPQNDPTSPLYMIVKRFLQTTPEYYRGPRPKWKLAFQSPPKLPIMIGENIEDANGKPLEVILEDADTSKPSAVPKVLQIELVPVLGNFLQDCWDVEEFDRGIEKQQEGTPPLLVGKNILNMWDGRTTVDQLRFTEQSLGYCCMFRIGIRVVAASYSGARILEGMTEAFMVRHRGDYELKYNEGYKWQLVFLSRPRQPIYVGRKITDVIGNPLEVILVDTETGSLSVPPMELNIELVLIKGYTNITWLHGVRNPVILPWEGKRLLLSGKVSLTMKGDVSLTMKGDGRVTVSELQFIDKPDSFVRIGVRVMPGSYNHGSGRILEGMSTAFMVEYIQSEMTVKYNNLGRKLGLDDPVCCLMCIPWGGELHKRLEHNKIRNVQDFLRMLAVRPEELRAIMGDGNEHYDTTTWEVITGQARSCVYPIDKVYAYSVADTTIYVDSIFELAKVEFEFGGMECLWQRLDYAQTGLVKQAMREAYEHQDSLQEVKLTLKLAFKRQPELPIHVGSRIVDATGEPLEVILLDAETGSPWALPTTLGIQLNAIIGDFPPYKDSDWSAEEYRTAVVKPRQKGKPLLAGDYGSTHIIVRDGCTTPRELLFRDDSSLVRCRKFRIGASAALAGNVRILEALTEAFEVENVNRKRYPPVLGDPVWTLDMIDKDGPLHRKLTSNNVSTVQEFLRMLNVKPTELSAMIREDDMTDGMWRMTRGHARDCKFRDTRYAYSGDDSTDGMWRMMTDHATNCKPGDKRYAYSGDTGTIYVDYVFHKLFKVEINGVECPLDMLDEAQIILVQLLILEAYEHPDNLKEVGVAIELCDSDDAIYIGDLLSGKYLMRFSNKRYMDSIMRLAGVELYNEEDDSDEEDDNF